MTAERDPHGTDQHAPGAKLDAGKLRPWLVLSGFAHAIQEVVKVGTDGAAKYSDYGWRNVPDGVERYSEALERHLMALRRGEEYDTVSGSKHLAHIAWNALAVLELEELHGTRRTKTLAESSEVQRPTQASNAIIQAIERAYKRSAREQEERDAQLPEIPAGWIEWDCENVEWYTIKMVAKRWLLGAWARCPEGCNLGDTVIIPGQDAGEALVGVECWVWSYCHEGAEQRTVKFISLNDSYWAGGSEYGHARPTYLGKPE